MDHIPPSQQRQEQEQEQGKQQEQGGLPQQLLQRQQRIAQLRVKRLSMSTIVDDSSSSFSSSTNPRCTSSSPTVSFSLPTSPTTRHSTTTTSSIGSISFLENHQTSNSNNSSSGGGYRRHSRRASLSISSSSSSDWQLISSNPALPVSGSSSAVVAPIHATPVPARRQQQQWTTKQPSESDGPLQLPFPSRPNSFASSYQPVMLSRKNSQRSSHQQQRQLDQQGTLTTTTSHSNNDNRYEKESNAAFERICSLLNHLITDASTAVSTSENKDPDGGSSVQVMIPRYLPMVCSDSENSDNDEHGQAQQQQRQGAFGPERESRTDSMMDDTRLDMDGRDFLYDEAHGEIPESPRDQIRRRIDDSRRKRLARTRSGGSYMTDPSKRTSLFLELQNFQVDDLVGEQHPSTPVLHHQHHHLDSGFELNGRLRQQQGFAPMENGVLSPGFGGLSTSRTLESLSTTTTTVVFPPATPNRSLDFDLFGSELGSPVNLTPRRRASFPPRRSDRIQLQRAEELHQVIQRVDAELDRTVETIDDLTRDLVAIATHQNWMKVHLEQTLGLQSPLSLTDFIQTDDSTFSTATAVVEEAGAGAGTASPKSPTIYRDRLEQMEDVIGVTKALLSSKEFANYYQVLERVRIMEQDDYDDYEQDGDVFDCGSSTGTKQGQQQQQQRLSGSSFTLTNGSFRHSSSSTLSLETRFGSCTDFKDGALLTSNSSRPSIEWSDRIGAPYSNSLSQDRIHPLVAPASLEPLQQDPVSPLLPFSSIQRLELTGDQPTKQETNQQGQHPTTLNTLLHQSFQEEEGDHNLSPDATLAINKLILACRHLVLLLFWTLALFLGVVITDGSILENAGRQLISSVEILQSHFIVGEDVHDNDNNALDKEMCSSATHSALQEQDQDKELDQTLLKTMVDPAPPPKSHRSHSSTARRRRTRPSSQQRHQHHHILLRHRQSSPLPQINAPGQEVREGVFETGDTFTNILGVGRFYNSPFLASSRYQVDISGKEPKAIQLGAGHGPLSIPSASTPVSDTAIPTTTAKNLSASLSSSCSSTIGLQDQDSLSSSISTASSSATLLDWLDSTTSTTTIVHTETDRQKKEVQAFTTFGIDSSNSNNKSKSERHFYEPRAASELIN